MAMYNPLNVFKLDFYYKHCTFDFGTRIDGAKKTMALYYCSHNYALIEAGTAA